MQNQKLRSSYSDLQTSVGNIQSELLQVRSAVSQNAEVLAAVISLLGQDSVQAEITRLRDEAQAKQEAALVENTKTLIEAGVLKTAETLDMKDGFGVGQNTDKAEGKTSRVQFEASSINPDNQPKFAGKKVGDVIDLGTTSLALTEVYVIDRERATAWQAEQQKAFEEGVKASKAATEAPVEAAAAPAPAQA
jgi:hypothetical protein